LDYREGAQVLVLTMFFGRRREAATTPEGAVRK
jgi:hypothetical protein